MNFNFLEYQVILWSKACKKY